MKAIIPVGGYATRLYPLTFDKPKALLKVKGKTIIGHIVRKIKEIGITEIYIVSNNKFYDHFHNWFLSSDACKDCKIKILNDNTSSNEDRLGQIGDIQFAIEEEKIDDDLLIIAGDNLFNFSLKESYDIFLEKKAFLNALYDIKSIDAAKQLGNIAIDDNLKVISFEEKPEKPKSTNVSLGIYFIPKDKVKCFSEYINEGRDTDKIGYFWTWVLEKGIDFYGYVYEQKWFDIGTLEMLELAQKEFETE